MSIEDFDTTRWGFGMRARYQGKTYDIAMVDFEEKIVGLGGVLACSPDVITWVRCENIELVPGKGGAE